MKKYSENLAARTQILVANKVDLYETDPIIDIPNDEDTDEISNTIINRHDLQTIDITIDTSNN